MDKNMKGKPLAIDVFTGALANPQDPTAQSIINNTPTIVLKDTNDTSKYTQNQKYAFQTEYIKQLASPRYVESIKGMSDGSRQDAMTSLTDYATLTKNTMFKEMNDLGKRGKNITLDVLPDGRLHLQGDVSSDFANKYVTRINDSIGAMANLMGTDTKTAAEKYFYPQFFKEIGSPTTTNQATNPVQPIHIQTKEELSMAAKIRLNRIEQLKGELLKNPTSEYLQSEMKFQQERLKAGE
jgi:hypothetical protein